MLLFTRTGRLERRGAVIAGSIAVGGFVINLLLIAGGIDDLITRNIISLWMPAAVAVAGGLAAVRARWLGLVCTVVLCAIGLTGRIAVATTYEFQKPDWRSVARALGPRPRAGVTRAILIQRYRDLLPLKLYMPRPEVLAQGDHRRSDPIGGRPAPVRVRRDRHLCAARDAVLVGRCVQPDAAGATALVSDFGHARGLDSTRAPVHDHAPGLAPPGGGHARDGLERADRDDAAG